MMRVFDGCCSAFEGLGSFGAVTVPKPKPSAEKLSILGIISPGSFPINTVVAGIPNGLAHEGPTYAYRQVGQGVEIIRTWGITTNPRSVVAAWIRGPKFGVQLIPVSAFVGQGWQGMTKAAVKAMTDAGVSMMVTPEFSGYLADFNSAIDTIKGFLDVAGGYLKDGDLTAAGQYTHKGRLEVDVAFNRFKILRNSELIDAKPLGVYKEMIDDLSVKLADLNEQITRGSDTALALWDGVMKGISKWMTAIMSAFTPSMKAGIRAILEARELHATMKRQLDIVLGDPRMAKELKPWIDVQIEEIGRLGSVVKTAEEKLAKAGLNLNEAAKEAGLGLAVFGVTITAGMVTVVFHIISLIFMWYAFVHLPGVQHKEQQEFQERQSKIASAESLFQAFLLDEYRMASLEGRGVTLEKIKELQRMAERTQKLKGGTLDDIVKMLPGVRRLADDVSKGITSGKTLPRGVVPADNTWLYVAGGLAALGVAGYFYFNRGK